MHRGREATGRSAAGGHTWHKPWSIGVERDPLVVQVDVGPHTSGEGNGALSLSRSSSLPEASLSLR